MGDEKLWILCGREVAKTLNDVWDVRRPSQLFRLALTNRASLDLLCSSDGHLRAARLMVSGIM